MEINYFVLACPLAQIIERLCRGKSKADFIAKAGISLEEADECLYWMEMLQEANIVSIEKLKDLMKEANEMVAIFTASIKTARATSKVMRFNMPNQTITNLKSKIRHRLHHRRGIEGIVQGTFDGSGAGRAGRRIRRH